jgi:hypothetical protein
VVVAAGLGAFALAGGSELALAIGVRLATAGLVALLAAVVLGWSPLVPVGAVLLGGAYATRLYADDVALDARAPLLAAGLLLAAELGYWSIDARPHVRGERGADLRHLVVVVLLALAGLAAGAILLAVADLTRARGLAVDLAGAAAAAGVLLLVALVALRPQQPRAR